MARAAHVSDPAWLEAAFAKPGTTIKVVAERAGCDEKTVRRWLKRFGMTTRFIGETASLRQANQEPLPATTLEVVEGELLGDGNLTAKTRRAGADLYAAHYQHRCRDLEYLNWLTGRLSGLEGRIYGPLANGIGTCYHYASRSYAALLPLYRRWYDESLPPRRRKIIPAGLVLTPVMALHWYLGDGSLIVDRRSAGTKPFCRISTDGFRLEDVERLAAQLGHCRGRIGRFGKGYRILVDSAPFLEWIGPCPIPEVHGHKWAPRPR